MKNKKEIKNSIIGSTLVVSSFVFLIKILGFVKQAVIASYFGATIETDIFFIASGVITSLGITVYSAITISSQSLYTEKLIRSGQASANTFLTSIIKIFLPLSILISILFMLFALPVAKMLAPTYTGVQLDLLSQYIRVMSVTLFLSCYFYLMNISLEANKIFIPAKGFSFFQNLFIIIASIIFSNKFGIVSLLYAFIFANIGQIILISFFAKKHYKFRFTSKIQWKEIKYLLKNSFPILVGSSIYQVNDIADKIISSRLGEGQVSILTYGQSINEIVSVIIVSSISIVLFSHYATWIAEGKIEKIKNNLLTTIEWLVILIFPITLFTIIFRIEIVEVLYGRGSFSWESSLLTSNVLFGYAVGFIFTAVSTVMIKVYYAFRDSKTPMINGAVAVGVNIFLSYIFSSYIGAAGIGLATSIAMLVSSFLAIIQFKKHINGFSLMSIWSTVFKSLMSTAVMSICVIILSNLLYIDKLITLIICGIFGILIYLVVMILLKCKIVHSTLCNIKGIITNK
jgi:putative peptidoglycan lipid II flippase